MATRKLAGTVARSLRFVSASVKSTKQRGGKCLLSMIRREPAGWKLFDQNGGPGAFEIRRWFATRRQLRDARGPMHPCIPLRLFIGGAWLFAAGAPLRGDITVPSPPPPQVDSLGLRVSRGEAVEIPLRAHYAGGGSVAFSIGRAPEHGTLSGLRLLGDNRGVVTYQQNATDPATTDSFSYAARSSDRVSAPAEVKIFVEEKPSRMRVPERIDFGEIVAGESETRTVEIRNEGGGVLEGRVTVSAPWTLGVADYRVPAGAGRELEIAFRPDEGREFVGLATLLSRDGDRTLVSLSGKATSPVTIEPVELRIGPTAKPDERRVGIVTLRNRTDRELSLRLEANAHLRSPPEVRLEAGGRGQMEIEVAAPPQVAVREGAAITGPGFRVPLTIVAPARAIKPNEPPVSPIRSPRAPATTSAPSSSSQILVPTGGPTAASASVAPVRFFVGVHARRLDSSRWELHWKQAQDPALSYRVDERFLALDSSRQLQTTWRPVERQEIARSGPEVVARLGPLDPDQLHMLRVVALERNGPTLWESPAVALAPARAAPSRGRGWLLLLGIALVGLLALRWRARA